MGAETSGKDGGVTLQEETVQVQGRVLGLHRAGRGPGRLLYLHDAGADTLASPAFDELSTDHAVVLLDLPGYGRSAPPEGLTGPAAMAEVLAGLLDTLGWEHGVVAGTSLGAWFALELALAAPERVEGLVLSGAAGLHTPEDYLFALFAGGRAAAGTQELIKDALTRRLPEADQDVSGLEPRVAAAVVGPFVQNLAAAAAMSWHPYTVNPRLLGRLPEVSCPTVVLWGEHDALIPLRHGRLLAAGIPGADLQIVPAAGHLLALEHPEVFAAAVRSVRDGSMLSDQPCP
jgi:pimeloyl-ACP methyl ester carboxylesterase